MNKTRISLRSISILILILILPPILPSLAKAEEQQNSITKLEDVIEATLKNSPDLQIAHEKIVQAQATLKQVKSSFYPAVNSTGTFTKFNKSSSISTPDFTALALDPTSTATVEKILQPDHSWGGNLSISVPLIIASLYPTIGASKLGEKAVSLAYELNKSAIVYNCTNLYLYSLLAYKNIEISKTALATTKDHLLAAKKRLQSGTGAQIDVTRSELLSSQADLNLIQAEEEYNLSRESLKILMNREFLNPSYIEEKEKIDYNNEEDTIKSAIGERKDHKIAQIEVEASQKVYQAAIFSYYPTLLAQGTFNIQDTENFNGDNYSWQGMLLFNWNIFSGFKNNADVSKAKSVFNEKKKNLISIEQKIRKEVTSAISHLKQANSKVKIAERQLSLAEINKNAVLIAYENGAVSHLDYTDAYSAWISSTYALSLTRIQILLAIAEFTWATGKTEIPTE